VRRAHVSADGQPVFSVGAHERTWADVVSAAREWGEWQRLERAAAAGLAAYKGGARADADEVEEAADDFRHERRLEAAEDAERWLERRGVTVAAFLLGIERSLVAREPPSAACAPPAATWLEAICSGALDRLATRLAQSLAAWDALGRPGDPPVGALDATVIEFRRAAATEARVESELAAHRLEWTQLELLVCRLDDRGAAQEVVHCVCEDGRALEELDLDLQRRDLELGGADAGWAALRPGELHGPVAAEGAYEVSVVTARLEPDASDPAVRARAAAAVGERALRSEAARRVRWREP
jgi:hypothetical protein